MASYKKLQNTISEIKQITHLEVALYTRRGDCIMATASLPQGILDEIPRFAESVAESETMDGFLLYKVMVEEDPEFILCLENSREDASMLGQMAVCQVRNLQLGVKESLDRNRFMHNVLLRNIILSDMMHKARKLHIDQRPRVVYIIDTDGRESEFILEMIRNLSDIKAGDFVINMDDRYVVMVKDVSHVPDGDMEKQLKNYAGMLLDTIRMEAMIPARIGYSNPSGVLEGLADAYQEAVMAIQVGKIFYPEQYTIAYGRLGIGRLIYQLPKSLCEMFIQEVFGSDIPDILEDEEAMSTINRFFENSLNISETARQLYLHRNTLVYRLERIEKAIGLDIRSFEDAIIFRIAVLVLAHLKNMQ